MVEQLSIIPDIALGLIAFSIGAEFKLDYLKRAGKFPVIIAFAEGIGAVIFVDLILIATGHDQAFSLVLGAIAAATAPVATLMVVRQYKAKGPVTETLLPVVAIDDAVALVVFGLSVAIAKTISSQKSASLVALIINPIIEIVGALIFGAVLGVVLKYLTNWFTGRGNRLSVSLAMILLCIGVSNMIGLSALLVCMTMSAVYANISKVSDTVFELVERVTPPIFMLFFFVSGAELDLSILPAVGIIGVLYIVFRVIGKYVGAAVGAELSHAQPVVAKYLGYTLILRPVWLLAWQV